MVEHDPSNNENVDQSPKVIVGIGASAGGLEAIEAFFQVMPADSSMAFVVIQHLSPDYKSMMVELLSRKTEIPVCRAEDGMTVLKNHIYLIPPKKNLTIFHGKLLLEDQKERDNSTINLPVDIFFRSLAEDQGENAVAIVLSGTGSDGTRGVRAIKEWGGLVMIQDPKSAKFDGMPRAASSTGVADFILTPREMPSQLVACLSHPYATRQELQKKDMAKETGLTRLFSLLRLKTKVDFTYYKPSTILRRIERRIAVTQVEDLEAYVRYAEQTPSEVSTLYREFLIGVTNFFRDPLVMQQLEEKVLPDLFNRFSEREIRFWIAGCSTGEEAYTLAIIACEVMENLGIKRDVRIFATDIDREAVAKAGTGIYSESIIADMNPQLLAKYFYKRNDGYHVARSIRQMVVFAQHNLIKDPPFTRIDLVSCRNLLIYLQNNLQSLALDMFSFSLRPGGILVLGNSETVGMKEDYFEPIDRKARIFKSLGKSEARFTAKDPVSNHLEGMSSYPVMPSNQRSSLLNIRKMDRLETRLLENLSPEYVSLAVVVNDQLEVVYTLGDPSGIFSMPRGKAVYTISKMVNRELAIPLSTGIQKVFRTGEVIVYSNVRSSGAADKRLQRLRISPFDGKSGDTDYVLVVFEPIEHEVPFSESETASYDLSEEASQRLQDLEQELQFTKENLQATIEELETSNEELQATNEELLASNEELQSTNEELQSTNEELYTVNSEYQNKIIELTEARNDVENLLSSSRIGTLILDEDLCIRHYSPQAGSVFHLVDSDIGRPLKHLAHKLIQFEPVREAFETQNTGKATEKEVKTKDGTWYLIRVLPYQISKNTHAGIVFTLIDITPLKEARDNLTKIEETSANIMKHMPSGLLVYVSIANQDLILEAGNPAAEEITGRKMDQEVGKSFRDLWPGKAAEPLFEELLQVAKSGLPDHQVNFHYHDKQVDGVFNINAFCLPNNRLAVSFEDVSERFHALRALKESEARYKDLCKMMADTEQAARMGSWTWDIASDTVTWSENLNRMLGRDPSLPPPSYSEHDSLYTPDSMEKLRTYVERCLSEGENYEIELEAIRQDGSLMPCIASGQCEYDEKGKVVRLFGFLKEVKK